MIFAHLFHAASFGLYHASAIQLVHRYFTGRHQGRGQTLYSSVSFGAGGAMGSLLSGLGWEVIGPEAVYMGAGAVALLATVVAWI
jgi:MFS transporter, PPP family, 3-phenylpropionic acid transporter